MSGFPPTLLTSGTRDLFLSNTARMHLKLWEAGVPATISSCSRCHTPNTMAEDAPETRFISVNWDAFSMLIFNNIPNEQ